MKVAQGLRPVEDAAASHGLAVLGAFHPLPGDAAPEGTGTLVLLGPAAGAGFWAGFGHAPESRDGKPDPLDRWSRRVLAALAAPFGAVSLLPSDGPPFPPFLAWAERSGRAWPSPVGMLVHDTAGLMVSYRGALALPRRLALAAPPDAPPCADCADRPCRVACPVGALGPDGYDVTRCRDFLRRPDGTGCMDTGCAARRACPVSQRFGRPADQSAFHMRAFNP